MTIFLYWLDSINTYVFGPIGFLISIMTLLLSLRINKKVNDSLDIHELKEKKEEIQKNFDNYIDLVTHGKLKKEESTQLRGFIYYINEKYPFYSDKPKTKDSINKVLECIQNDDFSSEELQKNLIRLKAQIERVIRV